MMTRLISIVTRRSALIVAAIAILAGLASAVLGDGLGVDSTSRLLRERVMERHSSGGTVVVGIDQRSLEDIQAWPWPRSVHGRMAERLARQGARRIVFDVAFPVPAADPRQDRRLAASLARTDGKVTLLALNDPEQGGAADALPLPELLKHASAGTGWIDHDGKRITLPYAQRVAGRLVPSLSNALAGGNARNGLFSPDWSISTDTIPVLSYVDVLEGRVPDERIRGKDVIVGAVAQAMGDRFDTMDGRRLPGVIIHALGAETIKHRVATPIGPWPALAIAVLIVLAGTAVRNRALSMALPPLGMAAVLTASWAVADQIGYEADIHAALAALATAFVTAGVAAIATDVMRRMTTDADTSLPNITAMRIDCPRGRATVAVRLHNHLETSMVLGRETQAQLLRRIRDRIRYSADDSVIYQVDEHSFAWRTDLDTADLTDSIEGLVKLLGAGIGVDSRTIDTPISAGIVEDVEDVLEAVTLALLAAEHAARQSLPWTRHVDAANDTEWRLTMMSELENALVKGDIWVAYQPKWDATGTTCIGAEALVRWTHPERGPIRPDQFIPILEEAGRIDGLTRHVLDRAVRDFASLGDLSVAVNLSTRMLGRGKVVEMVADTLSAHGMAPTRLTLEITESSMLSGDESIEELHQLRAMGVKISIDDYGTGQSTLTYLRKLPANELKIDQSFVRAMLTSRSDSLMIASTIALSHQLGLTVVAEGVETQEEMGALAALECDQLQGYLLGRPVPLTEFVTRNVMDIVLGRKTA